MEGQIEAQQPSTLVTSPSGGGSGSKIMIVLTVVILLIIALGGAFYFMSSRKVAEKPVASTPTIETSDLSSELQANQPTDIEGDFTEIDKDLQSL